MFFEWKVTVRGTFAESNKLDQVHLHLPLELKTNHQRETLKGKHQKETDNLGNYRSKTNKLRFGLSVAPSFSVGGDFFCK